MFFSALFAKPKVSLSKLVLTYFAQNAADQDSHDNIIRLNDLINISKNGGNKPQQE